MKVTANWVLQYFSFLTDLLKEREFSGRKKIILKVKTGPVEVIPPFHEGVSRFTSMGRIGGNSFTHFAGSDASIANNSTELLPVESPVQGRTVNPGCFYAIYDSLEHYGFRELTIYLNMEDLKQATMELKNQLKPLLENASVA
jgi:hypothetical protein